MTRGRFTLILIIKDFFNCYYYISLVHLPSSLLPTFPPPTHLIKPYLIHIIVESDSFVLDGFLDVDDPLLVEDPVAAVDALHVVVDAQSQLLAAFWVRGRYFRRRRPLAARSSRRPRSLLVLLIIIIREWRWGWVEWSFGDFC